MRLEVFNAIWRGEREREGTARNNKEGEKREGGGLCAEAVSLTVPRCDVVCLVPVKRLLAPQIFPLVAFACGSRD